MRVMSSSVCGRLAPSPSVVRRPSSLRAAKRLVLPLQRPARPAMMLVAAGQSSLLSAVEACLGPVKVQLSVEAAGTASRLQHCLFGLLLLVQRVVRWAQLAATAMQLYLSAQQQRQLALVGGAMVAPSGGDSSASFSAAPVAAATAAAPQQQQQPPTAAVMDFLSAATMGAVEQLRYTLTDASQGIESKMSAIERTVSSVQDTLFQAAQAHSEAVRSNPQGGMWKQPCVASVLSEEERLRQAVFAQVYAELCHKDNNQLGFNVHQQP